MEKDIEGEKEPERWGKVCSGNKSSQEGKGSMGAVEGRI